MKRVGGDPNWRDNNPGNMDPGPASTAGGAVGVNDRTPNGPFAIFPNQAEGFQAMINDLKSPQYRGLTLGQAIAKWAPPYQNDTARYQSFVSRALGLPITTPMSRLNTQQIDALGRTIQRFEGSRVGTSIFWPAPY